VKALTLTQPWATLVAIGAKRIETRSWPTKYRGPLAIHSAKTLTEDDFYLIRTRPFFTALESILDLNDERNVYGLPFGCVVAICELIRCWKISKYEAIPEPEHSFGDYTPGRYAWLLADVKLLPSPIPARGMLGLWDWNEGKNAN
jgi:activating signal cointegrator 1